MRNKRRERGEGGRGEITNVNVGEKLKNIRGLEEEEEDEEEMLKWKKQMIEGLG